ncbi:MAG: hypothetical protein ACOCP8_07740 [archaeon]
MVNDNKQMEIKINKKNGSVKVEANNYTDDACHEDVDQIVRNLGNTINYEKKNDFDQQIDLHETF